MGGNEEDISGRGLEPLIRVERTGIDDVDCKFGDTVDVGVIRTGTEDALALL